jgi:hypothetical protein
MLNVMLIGCNPCGGLGPGSQVAAIPTAAPTGHLRYLRVFGRKNLARNYQCANLKLAINNIYMG